MQFRRRFPLAILCFSLLFVTSAFAQSDDKGKDKEKVEKPKPEFPSLEKVTKDYTEVKPKDGSKPYMRLWKNSKTGQVLAELPKDCLLYTSPSPRDS